MTRIAENDAFFRSLSGQKVDKYELLNFIGAGRIGYVYKAQLEDFPGSLRAVKLIFGELKAGWDNELKKVMQLEVVEGVVHFHHLGPAQIGTKLCQYTVRSEEH